jgi:hypothetical protein
MLFKMPVVKSGATGDDQAVQNQMRQFLYKNITAIHMWYKVTHSSSHDPRLSLNDIKKTFSKDINTKKIKL